MQNYYLKRKNGKKRNNLTSLSFCYYKKYDALNFNRFTYFIMFSVYSKGSINFGHRRSHCSRTVFGGTIRKCTEINSKHATEVG